MSMTHIEASARADSACAVRARGGLDGVWQYHYALEATGDSVQ